MWRAYVALLSLSCWAAFPTAAQQSTALTSDSGQSARAKPPTPKSGEKPALGEVIRVSTAEVARNAAKDTAKAHGHDKTSEEQAIPDVLEFHAADPDGQRSAAATDTSSKDSKKSALRNIHGDAHGALGGRGAGSQTGGSVGATSKGGKSSIYVEADRSRETTPAPH